MNQQPPIDIETILHEKLELDNTGQYDTMYTENTTNDYMRHIMKDKKSDVPFADEDNGLSRNTMSKQVINTRNYGRRTSDDSTPHLLDVDLPSIYDKHKGEYEKPFELSGLKKHAAKMAMGVSHQFQDSTPQQIAEQQWTDTDIRDVNKYSMGWMKNLFRWVRFPSLINPINKTPAESNPSALHHRAFAVYKIENATDVFGKSLQAIRENKDGRQQNRNVVMANDQISKTQVIHDLVDKSKAILNRAHNDMSQFDHRKNIDMQNIENGMPIKRVIENKNIAHVIAADMKKVLKEHTTSTDHNAGENFTKRLSKVNTHVTDRDGKTSLTNTSTSQNFKANAVQKNKNHNSSFYAETANKNRNKMEHDVKEWKVKPLVHITYSEGSPMKKASSTINHDFTSKFGQESGKITNNKTTLTTGNTNVGQSYVTANHKKETGTKVYSGQLPYDINNNLVNKHSNDTKLKAETTRTNKSQSIKTPYIGQYNTNTEATVDYSTFENADSLHDSAKGYNRTIK